MDITLNGRETRCDDGTTVSDVLERVRVGEDAAGVAVAVNDSVVPRSAWETTRLTTGDRVEVIHAVQGG